MMQKLKVKPIAGCLYGLACLLLPIQSLADDTQPTLELLEFLAEWETDNGEWIDPLQMQNLARQTPEDEQPEAQSND